MKKLKIHWIIFALVILCLLPASLFATDYAKLNFIGFSNDGKYLAFEEYGAKEDGESYSNIFFVDVAKNSYAANPIRKVIIGDNSGDENTDRAVLSAVRSRAKIAAASNLKKFRIVTGNTGDLVVARLMTDLGGPDDQLDDDMNVQSSGKAEFVKSSGNAEFVKSSGGDVIYFTDQMFFGPIHNKFVLSLETTGVELKDCEYGAKFELRLRALYATDKNERVLHKDPTLPASRGCVESYSIQNVYLYNNRIAVFLNVYLPGFEGKDMRYLVVTANHFKVKR